MLVLLAAATLAAAQPAPFTVSRVDSGPADAQLLRGRLEVLPPSAVCAKAGRMQTGYDPALLFRQGEQVGPKLLARLPMAHACLLGGVSTGAGR